MEQTAPLTDESALVARLRQGESIAYEEVMRLYGGRLLAVARRMLSSEDEAMDVVQEAYISAFRSIGNFQEGSTLYTWLHRITINAALMRLRRRRRKPETSIEDLLPTYLEDGHRRVHGTGWTEPTSSLLERKETRDAILRSIDKLPDNYRTVLLLRDIEGLDTESAARALEETPGTVKTRLHRARQALRELLEQEFGAES